MSTMMKPLPRAVGALRVVIADDEPLSLDRMRSSLEPLDHVVIVGECRTGNDVLEMLRRERFDLLLLDIQMPGFDGLTLARRIQDHGGPAVVFVTAHDEHAIHAFDLRAVDYVLKPFDTARLHRAVLRASDAIDRGRALARQGAPAPVPLPEAAPGVAPRSDSVSSDERPTLLLRDGYRRQVIDVREIGWIESYGNYVKIHAGGEAMLHRETMTTLEKGLASRRFVRVHRNAIVNLGKVAIVGPGRDGRLVVTLTDGTRLRVGRRYRPNVAGFLHAVSG